MGIEMEAISRLEIASRKYDATKSKLEVLLSKKDLKTFSGFDIYFSLYSFDFAFTSGRKAYSF